MIERCVCAEPLLAHLPGRVVADRVGICGWRTSQVAAEARDPASLIVGVIDDMPRGVGLSLDVARQIVGILNIVTRPPTAPLPEVLTFRERAPERVVTFYRHVCGVNVVNAAYLRPVVIQTPYPVHRPVIDPPGFAYL